MGLSILPGEGEVDGLRVSGTRIAFQQATAPNGWSVDTTSTYTDCSMRINSSTAGLHGGTTVWSSWNSGGSFNVNTFTLSVAQLAPHTHVDVGHTHVDSGHAHTQHPATWYDIAGNAFNASGGGSIATAVGTGTGAGFASIETGFANLANAGSGAGITPTYTTPQVKYADFLIGQKI